jgi:iron complex transport system substrate-binding protein
MIMKRAAWNLVSLTLALTVALTACGPKAKMPVEQPPAGDSAKAQPTTSTIETAEIPITVSDDLGVEIALSGPARRIISISPSLTEILYGVGAGDRLIGRDSNSTFPAEALDVADLGGMWDGIPVEDILALEPDLVLAGEIYSAETIEELRDLGLTVYWQANPDDFDGLYQNIKDIAVLTGTGEEADLLVSSLQARVAELQVKLESAEGTPLVFYELDASDPSNPWSAGSGTFISYLIAQARAKNLGDGLEGEWVQISSEELVVQDPDIILLADALYGVTPESLLERAGWDGIKAVVNGQVYTFDPFILSVPGPRLVDGFEELAVIIHPEIGE